MLFDRRNLILCLALPYIFGAKTSKKPRIEDEASTTSTSAMAIPAVQINMNTAPTATQVLPLGMPQERLYNIPPYMVREYRDSLLAQSQTQQNQSYTTENHPQVSENETGTSTSTISKAAKRKLYELKNQSNFEYYQGLTNDGLYHKLPSYHDEFADLDPSDYLALAIRAHDAAAIDSCKNIVALESASRFLQTTLIDAIVKDEADIMEVLGTSFPSIFTTFYAFHPPYAHLSGTSLIRIAVDQEKSKVAKAMLKFVPVAMVGDFWQSIDSMKKFIIGALHSGDINLTPTLEGDTGLAPNVLIEMYYACVLEGDLQAMAYLLENTDVDIKTMFTGTNGVSLSAMFMAAHTGHSGIVSYLYKKCPELARIPNSLGMLPIHMAAGNGHMDVIKILSAEADTLTAEVTINDIAYTPFSLAIRNKKRNIADLIISFIRDQDNYKIQKEMTGLAYWAILDDNVQLLDIYFDFNSFPSSGCVDEEYNLLEMAILGIINPKRTVSSNLKKKTSSKKCLTRLIEEWKKHNLPYRIHHEGVISGSILGLVYPHDLDAFLALVKDAGVQPNEPIIITAKREDGTSYTLTTTFLNHAISLGATDMVPFAISKGCDPRILDSDGNDAIKIAKKYNNTFILDYFKQIYSDFAVY